MNRLHTLGSVFDITVPLSQAILKGCELKPNQFFGHYYGVGTHSSCVVGAMIDGLVALMPEVPSTVYACTGVWVSSDTLDEFARTFGTPLVLANDTKKWSREDIAAKLATLE